MLTKTLRVNQDAEILSILRKGRRASSDVLSLLYLPNQRSFSRFGFIVSKKVSNKTTRRNLAKRRMRSIVAKHRSQFPTGYDFLLIARPKIINLSFGDLTEKINSLLQIIKTTHRSK